MKIIIRSIENIILEGVCSALQKEKGINISGITHDDSHLITICEKDRPDVVMFQIHEKDTEHFAQTLDNIKRLSLLSGLVLILPEISLSTFYELYECGVKACINPVKSSTNELLSALQAAKERRLYIPYYVVPHSTSLSTRFSDVSGNDYYENTRLGNRELQVLTLLANGCASKKIAQILKISTSTVEVHRRNIMTKTGLHNIADLTRFAIRKKLITA